MWNVFFSLLVEADIFGDTSRKMCGLLWRWFLLPRTTSRKLGRKKSPCHQPINSIHIENNCQQEEGHVFRLMSVSSNRLWVAGWRCSGRPYVTGVSVKRDGSQTESATFLCESLLSSAPFPFTLSCLPLSPRSLLLTSWEIPSARAECPQPSCWVLHPAGSLRPTWLLILSPGGLNAELRVLVQPLLFFRSKLGNGVRSTSTWGKAKGNGVGTDKWEPHLTSKPKCAYSWTSCLTSPFIGIGAKQLVSLIWPVLSPIICLMSTKQFDKWNR